MWIIWDESRREGGFRGFLISQMGDLFGRRFTNPSDSWIYKLSLLIQVRSNAIPIGSVASWLSEGKSKDVFDEKGQISSNPHLGFPLTPNFPMMDTFGFDVIYPDSEGRLLILSALAPKEDRALWIKGSSSSNSVASIEIIEYSREPFSLRVNAEGVDGKFAQVIWDGPSSNSVFWKHFPRAVPMDLGFGGGFTAASNTPPNTPPSTNSPSLEIPTRSQDLHLVTPQKYP
jgi:hypothetical protein